MVNQTRHIVRMPEVRARTGLGPSTIYRLIALGKFPAPRRLPGVNAVGWFSDEIDAVVNSFTPITTDDVPRRMA
jgi:prophage regulatory protein